MDTVFNKYILQTDLLCERLRPLRAEGKKVVFTNGVFDLIHPGHIRYLAAAKELGDLLVVALNTDVSVKRLKGEKRPILNLYERSKIIASLEMVDFVTSFDEDTPLEVIKKIMPDVLVKGGDYRPETIVGCKEVVAAGGKCLNLQLEEGFSSTNIIERIIRMNKKNKDN